jgi:hypothetical protein
MRCSRRRYVHYLNGLVPHNRKEDSENMTSAADSVTWRREHTW